MIRAGAVLALLWVGCAAAAQQEAIIVSPLDELEERAETEDGDGFGGALRLRDEEFQTFEQDLRVAQAEAGLIRVLDKTTGRVETLEIPAGQALESGRLTIVLSECRFPEENPASDAFVHVTITERDARLYDGWMIASSPALAALDHHRYDVWALRCATPGEELATPEVSAGLQSPRPAARP